MTAKIFDLKASASTAGASSKGITAQSVIDMLQRLRAKHGPCPVGIAMTEDDYQRFKISAMSVGTYPAGKEDPTMFYGFAIFIKAFGPPEPLFSPKDPPIPPKAA